MTRKSRREVESAIENLADDTADPNTVREWVSTHLEDSLAEGFDYDPTAEFSVVDGDDDADTDGEVCVWKATGDVGTEFWTDVDEIPDWIDVEGDLPVRT